jgi:saccharopine dehydrogenase (NADP+, L-glutamate forming)
MSREYSYLQKYIIASRRLENAQALAKQFPGTVAVSCDINNEEAIEKLVAQHDVSIRYVLFVELAYL